jgi:hypothetical protein
MAKVIRLGHGGGAVVEESELTIEQAQSLAQRLAVVGEPAGCCWCVGLWEEEEKGAGESLRYEESRAQTAMPIDWKG